MLLNFHLNKENKISSFHVPRFVLPFFFCFLFVFVFMLLLFCCCFFFFFGGGCFFCEMIEWISLPLKITLVIMRIVYIRVNLPNIFRSDFLLASSVFTSGFTAG